MNHSLKIVKMTLEVWLNWYWKNALKYAVTSYNLDSMMNNTRLNAILTHWQCNSYMRRKVISTHDAMRFLHMMQCDFYTWYNAIFTHDAMRFLHMIQCDFYTWWNAIFTHGGRWWHNLSSRVLSHISCIFYYTFNKKSNVSLTIS